MAQGQIQTQRQQQVQKQIMTANQMQLLQAKLSELPVAQLAECIRAEIDDNPALEQVLPDDHYDNDNDNDSFDNNDNEEHEEDYETMREREERQSELDEAMNSIGKDDEELPVYYKYSNTNNDDIQEEESIYDSLNTQMIETELTPKEREIMEYLIGSLDNDGWLRKSTLSIADEMAIYNDIDVNQQEIENVLKKLQEFDPAGVGARSLKECLLLQIERRTDSSEKEMMKKVIDEYYDEFIKKQWNVIQKKLAIDNITTERLLQELTKLNPKPGLSFGSNSNINLHNITPDVYIDSFDDGTVTFSINNYDAPHVAITPSFLDMMKQNQGNADTISRQMREAMMYVRNKVSYAQMFINALKMRNDTLTSVVKAIVNCQHDFFVEGDESYIKPMTLKDLSEKTGFDISTISRTCKGKYAQTRWGMFPFRYFFSDKYTTDNGDEMSTRSIKAAMNDIIDGEDKKNPLSDEAIAQALAEKGFPIARRTVAKYREQLGIPVAKMRK